MTDQMTDQKQDHPPVAAGSEAYDFFYCDVPPVGWCFGEQALFLHDLEPKQKRQASACQEQAWRKMADAAVRKCEKRKNCVGCKHNLENRFLNTTDDSTCPAVVYAENALAWREWGEK